jgi:hypothetical protein
MWGALSEERSGLFTTIVVGPRQRSHSRVRVPWDSRPYFTVSLSVASYDSQGYSESIRPRLPTGVLPANHLLVLSLPGEDRRQKTMSHISSVIQRIRFHANSNSIYLAVA